MKNEMKWILAVAVLVVVTWAVTSVHAPGAQAPELVARSFPASRPVSVSQLPEGLPDPASLGTVLPPEPLVAPPAPAEPEKPSPPPPLDEEEKKGILAY